LKNSEEKQKREREKRLLFMRRGLRGSWFDRRRTNRARPFSVTAGMGGVRMEKAEHRRIEASNQFTGGMRELERSRQGNFHGFLKYGKYLRKRNLLRASKIKPKRAKRREREQRFIWG